MASLEEVKRSGSVSFRVTTRAHLFIQSFDGGKQFEPENPRAPTGSFLDRIL